ncbi:RTA1 like protein-domain-containing protein [Chaetomidium leptoderma]|uniref:RTA1 like protein-domain-containing protein n=1 Tax=Chaetomidium leptoderma TaxID=669021 RepID=A0AAN6VQ86_9PEZI|nr:RTA1 like protein-domain-containing protein [Chaetomidium leptoderma]
MSYAALPPGAPIPPPYVVFFGPKANCTLDICPLEYSVYGYRPSLAANLTFIALYAIAAVIHAYLGFRWKQWWFMGCMLVGAVNAILGYVGRVMLYYNPFNFNAFMLQIICVSTGPVYYCAAIYITLALSINHLSPSLSRFQPKLFYYIFIPCDILSLILQAAGGGLSTSSSGQSQVGVDLALAGLSFQVFTILLFCGFFIDYLVRYFGDSSSHRRGGDGGDNLNRTDTTIDATRLRLFFGFMVLAVLLTLARCAFRLAELHQGWLSGGLIREEGLFIGLEGVIILTAVFCLMIGHPGLVFKPERKDGVIAGQSQQEMQEYDSK